MNLSLVLSGGATRGFYHIGVLDALREKKVVISDIAGTSVGAIIGAIVAANPERDVAAILKNLQLARLIEISLTNTGSMFGTKKIERMLRELTPAERFEDLRIPLTVIATDVNTGEEIAISSGPLIPAILASSAVPGIFPPVVHNNRILVDGGVVNNVPIDYARGHKVLVSDVTFALLPITKRSSTRAIITNALFIMVRNTAREERKNHSGKDLRIVTLQTPMYGAEMRKSQLHTLIEQGRKDTLEVLEKW